jgi:hypothetical protein
MMQQTVKDIAFWTGDHADTNILAQGRSFFPVKEESSLLNKPL